MYDFFRFYKLMNGTNIGDTIIIDPSVFESRALIYLKRLIEHRVIIPVDEENTDDILSGYKILLKPALYIKIQNKEVMIP